MKRLSILAIAGALLAVGVAGCGEREQTALYKDGKYRGKPDTQPWENAPAAVLVSLQANLDFSLGVQFFGGPPGSEYARLQDLYYAQVQWFL